MPLKNKQISAYVKSSGIFVPDEATAKIQEAILNRYKFAASFENAMESLVDALATDPASHNDFFVMLDEIRVLGLLEMVKRYTHVLPYHTAEHAAEASSDTATALHKILETKFPSKADKLSNQLILYIAIAAAAWHDVVQLEGSPNNEVDSAEAFVSCMENKLNIFKQLHYKSAAAMNELLPFIHFIANELIIYDTWLVFSMNENRKMMAKTLRQHSKMAEATDTSRMNIINPIMMKLAISADAISICDTSRYALPHVIEEKALVTSMRSLPKNARQELADFFSYADIKDNKTKEKFLGLIGQDIRMFTEQNPPTKAYISKANYQFYLKSLGKLQAQDRSLSAKDFKSLLDMFITTIVKKANATNIKQEIEFAHALGSGLWERHAKDLSRLKRYYNKINSKHKSYLGEALFIIAASMQPGLTLLAKDEKFRSELRSEIESHAVLTLLHLTDRKAIENMKFYLNLLENI